MSHGGKRTGSGRKHSDNKKTKLLRYREEGKVKNLSSCVVIDEE